MDTFMKFFIAYVVGIFITFGFAYNADYETPKNQWVSAGELNVSRSLLCGITWPLYWTVKAFTPLRAK